MTSTTKLPSLNIHVLTQEQYDAIEAKDPNAFYFLTDGQMNYGDLTGKPFIPSNTSDLTNDSGFITAAVSALANYYLKTETYSKNEVLALVGQISTVNFERVETLPATGTANIIYLVPKAGSDPDIHDEYIWVNGKWELIGNTLADLTNYYDKTQADNRFALKTAMPTKLPNPSSLTFTGAVRGTYDGSKSLTIDIPQGGGSSEMASEVISISSEEPPTQLNPQGNIIYTFDGSTSTPIPVLFKSPTLGGNNKPGQRIIFACATELQFNFMSDDMGNILHSENWDEPIGADVGFLRYDCLISYNSIFIEKKLFKTGFQY